MFDLGSGESHFHSQRTHTELYKSLYQLQILIWEEEDEKKILKIYLKEICPMLVNNTIIFRQGQKLRNCFFTTNPNLSIQLKPDDVLLWYFKLRIFYLTEFIGWKSQSLRH